MRKLYNVICEELLSMYGERIVLLRHDVDNVYAIYGGGNRAKVALKKLLNYALLGLACADYRINYLIPRGFDSVFFTLDLEKTYDCKATWFFRAITVPPRRVVLKLKLAGHEIAYHSDRNWSYKLFLEDLRLVEKATQTSIRGFTKHGLSPVRSGGAYPIKIMMLYGIKARLKYFAQGEGFPHWRVPRRISGLWVFGHHITLKKTPLIRIRKYITSEPLPLVLIHPEDLVIPGETVKLEYIASKARCTSVWDVVEKLERIWMEHAEDDAPK